MKPLTLPTFFPDATRGVIRGLDSHDLKQAQVEGVIVNTYHLFTSPGQNIIKLASGIKKFMNWDGVVISDSGGFQLLSLIYKNKSFGSINDEGVTFYKNSRGGKEKYNFTPEKSIQMQFSLGADIMVCLDDCPPIKASIEDYKTSVRRTIEWAKRSKAEYLKQVEQRGLKESERPWLFGVIQGGNNQDLRKECADELIKIGFDGYGFGGWPLDQDGQFDQEILKFTADLMPDNLPKYALGVGNPQSIADCYKMGYNIFDCVLPTRDGRHQRLYILKDDPLSGSNYEYLYIAEEKYANDFSAIDPKCDCFCCLNYTKSYLHHLFSIGDSLAERLATIHNLRTYTRLMEGLRING